MKLFNLSRTSAVLFVIAALVACNSNGTGYSPIASPDVAQQSAQTAGSVHVPLCDAKKLGAGVHLIYLAVGNVRGTTFRALTANGGSSWMLVKYTKGGPTPTPPPSPSSTPSTGPTPSAYPTPSASPTPTPTPGSSYLYYGKFAMKNNQLGCAYLQTPKNGKQSEGSGYNSFTYGLPNLGRLLNGKMLKRGVISSLEISNLSSKGGAGTATLVTSKGAPYTTGSITLIGREVIKTPSEANQLLHDLWTH